MLLCNIVYSLTWHSIFEQNIVRQYPFHVDSLLQICEICKLGEDWETAAEIIGQFVIMLLSIINLN